MIRTGLETLMADYGIRRYAHYISRAAFAGTRINLRQVSPESEPIYDFILTLHKNCNGRHPIMLCSYRY